MRVVIVERSNVLAHRLERGFTSAGSHSAAVLSTNGTILRSPGGRHGSSRTRSPLRRYGADNSEVRAFPRPLRAGATARSARPEKSMGQCVEFAGDPFRAHRQCDRRLPPTNGKKSRYWSAASVGLDVALECAKRRQLGEPHRDQPVASQPRTDGVACGSSVSAL